jgi:hypothetical protein
MNKQLIAAALALAFSSSAFAGEKEAYAGVAADGLSTAAALARPGFTETNPLGWATLPIRLAIIEHAKTLPREEGQPLVDMVTTSGWMATANNLLALAGAGAAAPVVGLAVGYMVWKSGEKEREFWNMCAVHKKYDANVKCNFRAWQPEEVTQVAQQQEEQRLAALKATVTVASSD